MAEKEETSKEEQIGFHKGSLATLAKERQELARILNIVEQLMHMHIKALGDLGVDLTKDMEGMQGTASSGSNEEKKKKKPIEDLI